MNLFKQLLVAGALALVGIGAANATPVIRGDLYVQMDAGDPGDFDNTWTIDTTPDNGFQTLGKNTEFLDYFVFNVPDDEYVNFVAFGGGVNFSAFDLYVYTDGTWLAGGSASQPNSVAGGVFLLTSGTYEIDLSGITTRNRNAYELDIFGSPVPEPGSWALLLAGLGAMGMLARRRGKSMH